MLQVSASDVNTYPFPYVLSDEIIPSDLYRRLRADYPTQSIFADQKAATGLSGSRTGQGFDIYRGDTVYERLIASSDAWAEFDAWINSAGFVEKFLEVFGPYLEDIGCRARINPARYRREIIEGRSGMTERPTLRDRWKQLKNSLSAKASLGEVELFSRLDIHKAMKGYNKSVHADRPNRLCSFILYFVDAEKEGIEGGTLTIHAHREVKTPRKYERHPRPEDAPVVATVKPRENLGVWFPCCNNSYHGVQAMVSNGKQRDYLYINISAEADTLW